MYWVIGFVLWYGIVIYSDAAICLHFLLSAVCANDYKSNINGI